MGGTDRISQPPGKIAGKRKNSGLWNIATQKLPKIYFSVSKQLLRKTTSCTASFTRRVSAKKSLKSNHAFPQHFINAEVCICNDVRLHWRTRLSPHAAKITFNQTESFRIKLIHSESIESDWICWIRLNLLNQIESAESAESHWISPNHIETIWITLQTFRIKDWKLKLTAHFRFYGTYSPSHSVRTVSSNLKQL